MSNTVTSNERTCRKCEQSIPWDWVFCAWCGEENDRHHELCDVRDVNAEGIRKPCNCKGRAVETSGDVRVQNLLRALDAKQAKIDALMMEFCPGEMSKEQREEWAKHQQPVPADAERIHLPKITPELVEQFGGAYTLMDPNPAYESGYDWSQEAVDFACMLKEAATRSPVKSSGEGCRYPMSYGARCATYPDCVCGREAPPSPSSGNPARSKGSTDATISDGAPADDQAMAQGVDNARP